MSFVLGALAVLSLAAPSARGLSLAPSSAQGLPPPERPRDPWVFRSVLDGKPRIVTIALSKEMWVAYDATNCSLHKVWKGGVQFDGAVYTTEHGPQPTSTGAVYVQGFPGDVWRAEAGGARVAAKTTWRGYELDHGRVVLHYEIALPDGRRVAVRESPEFVRPEELVSREQLEEWVLTPGHPGLLRTYRAIDMPSDVKLTVQVRLDGITGKLAEALERERRVETKAPDGSVLVQDEGHVVLTAQRPVNNLVLFFAPLPDAAPIEASAETETKSEAKPR